MDQMRNRRARWELLPTEHAQEAMAAYIDHGRVPSDFLSAVLTNNLRRTFETADSINLAAIHQYLLFLYNDAPAECWGSLSRVERWVAKGGLAGFDKE
jgi:hypothetical protein